MGLSLMENIIENYIGGVSMNKNPFEMFDLDTSTAEEVIRLYVPLDSHFDNIKAVGHSVLNGPRGSGKSMVFRYMMPDCQMKEKEKKLIDLEFLSIYLPIKKSTIIKKEFEFTENNGGEYITEHSLVNLISYILFDSLAKYADNNIEKEALLKYYNNSLLPSIEMFGANSSVLEIDCSSSESILKSISNFFYKLYIDFTNGYAKKASSGSKYISYNGPLFSYSDFFISCIEGIKSYGVLPAKMNVYLLIDDADNLNIQQQMILNTWIYMRTSNIISIKISTQMNYRTWKTINGRLISHPHDYKEYNILNNYTSSKTDYRQKIKDIIDKRLEVFGYDGFDAYGMFPVDAKQKDAIERIKEKIEAETNYDTAYRISSSEYYKSLKNKYTYIYSGLDVLIDISSGVIREFLNFAFDMYVEQKKQGSLPIKPNVQNKIIREYSMNYYSKYLSTDHFEEYSIGSDLSKVYNIMNFFGLVFEEKFNSNDSERRVFSMMIDHDFNDELAKVFKLGIELGFFTKRFVGSKSGYGKTTMYSLNRVLAPYFKLDPSGISTFLSVKKSIVEIAVFDYKRAFSEWMSKKNIEDNQISLF